MKHFPNSIQPDNGSVGLSVIRFVAAFCLIAFGLYMLGVHIGSLSSYAGITALACAVAI